MLVTSFVSLSAGAAATLFVLFSFYSNSGRFGEEPLTTSNKMIIELMPERQPRFVLTLPASGKGLGLFPVESFDSASFPFFVLELENYHAIDQLRLVWRDNRSNETYSYLLPGISRGRTIVAAGSLPEWEGEILGVGLLVEGRPGAHVKVLHASLQPWNQRNFLAAIFASWVGVDVWRLQSINYYQAANSIDSPFMQVPIVALWIGFSLLVFLLSRFAIPLNRSATWNGIAVIVLAGWLMIDVLWQRTLVIQLQNTWADHDDKALSDRLMIESNAKIRRLITLMRGQMVEAGFRVFVNSEKEYNAKRAAYEFYPANVYWHRRERGDLPMRYLRTGDYIALVEPTSIRYESDGNRLLTESGENVSAVRIWKSADGALYRVE